MKKRGLGKIKTDYTQDDLYKFYKANSHYDLDISKEKFQEIIKKFNREVIKLIIYKNFEFKMPYTLGVLRIRKRKQKALRYNEDGSLIKNKLNMDYNKTLALWERDEKAKQNKKIVIHLNEHSNGYIYGFYWDKRKTNIRNKESYKFKTARSNARWLASVIKDDSLKIDYFE